MPHLGEAHRPAALAAGTGGTDTTRLKRIAYRARSTVASDRSGQRRAATRANPNRMLSTCRTSGTPGDQHQEQSQLSRWLYTAGKCPITISTMTGKVK